MLKDVCCTLRVQLRLNGEIITTFVRKCEPESESEKSFVMSSLQKGSVQSDDFKWKIDRIFDCILQLFIRPDRYV